MSKKNLIVAVHSGDVKKGGVYNVLSSFANGLLQGFKDADIQAYSTKECIEKGIDFNLAIGFNQFDIQLH